MTETIKAPQTEIRYSKMLSFGASRGSRIMLNDDIVEPMDSNDEWIRRRTGITQRTYAAPDQSLLDMGVAAGAEALANSGLQPDQIDAVIFSSCTNPYQVPSLGPLIADRLGIKSKPAAYDTASACSGYTMALLQADALVRSGLADNVLIVAADRMTDVLDPADRATAPLFADGAGAAVVAVSDVPGISKAIFGSDGSKHDAFWMTSTYKEHWDAKGEIPQPTMRQEGQTIYRWAVYEMGKIGKQVIEAAGLTVDDIDAFIPHQANVRIIDELANQIGLNEERTIIARDVTVTGNTSAATIPLATHALLQEHPELSGKLALQLGFGAGLAYAGQIVRLP